jgi:ATP-dependent Clp protease ATP-binding subunit ClpA
MMLHDEQLEEEFKKRLIDRFEGWELVEYLNLSADLIVEIFEDEINEVKDELEEFLSIGR